MALSLENITEVIGPVDKHVATALVGTDASLADLEAAWAWLRGDETVMNEERSLPTGRIALLIDILAPPANDGAS